MSLTLNMVGGGGSDNTYAFIVVTYPAGSTCTCVKGSKTLRAKDTTGTWAFQIPEAGTWTVSCTDGINFASANVVISSEGQSESVELSYRVPSGYKEIEYIESPSTGTGSGDSVDGAAFINTGLGWNYTTIKIDLGIMFLSNSYSGIVASQDSPQTMLHRQTSNNFRLQWPGLSGGSNYGSGYQTNVMYNLILEVSDNGSLFSVDGNTLVSTTTHNAVSKNSVFPLLAEYWNGRYRYTTQGRIYSAKIWIDGVLVRDFAPCYRESDSVVGLWDVVSKAFFTSAGTGAFIAGPDV